MADAIARLDVPENQPVGSRTPLGALLREAGFLSAEQLEGALREGAATGERLGEVVVRRGWASEDDIAKLLAEQWQLGYVERASIWFDVDALGRMSREQAQRLEALPTRVEDGRVVVAVAEPTDERLAALREVIGDDTVVVVVPKTALDAGLRSELLEAEERHEGDAEQRGEHSSAPVPAPEPAALAQAVARVERPLAPRTAAPAVGVPTDVGRLLQSLADAAADADVLQQRVADLARRLETISGGLSNVAEQLAGGPADRARIERLEEQLAHRTELTERLKSQLVALTSTLENLD